MYGYKTNIDYSIEAVERERRLGSVGIGDWLTRRVLKKGEVMSTEFTNLVGKMLETERRAPKFHAVVVGLIRGIQDRPGPTAVVGECRH